MILPFTSSTIGAWLVKCQERANAVEKHKLRELGLDGAELEQLLAFAKRCGEATPEDSATVFWRVLVQARAQLAAGGKLDLEAICNTEARRTANYALLYQR